MRPRRLLSLAFAAFLLAAGAVACDSNDGPAEKAGEAVDEAAEETKDAAEDAADDVEDATDGN